MKIQEFYSKVRTSKEGLFLELCKLRDIDTHVLAAEPGDNTWTPWPEMTETSEVTAQA